MQQLIRDQRRLVPNPSERETGWVVSFYQKKEEGRWSWEYRGGVYHSPVVAADNIHRSGPYLRLVRPFPHYLNDVVEIPIWP